MDDAASSARQTVLVDWMPPADVAPDSQPACRWSPCSRFIIFSAFHDKLETCGSIFSFSFLSDTGQQLAAFAWPERDTCLRQLPVVPDPLEAAKAVAVMRSAPCIYLPGTGMKAAFKPSEPACGEPFSRRNPAGALARLCPVPDALPWSQASPNGNLLVSLIARDFDFNTVGDRNGECCNREIGHMRSPQGYCDRFPHQYLQSDSVCCESIPNGKFPPSRWDERLYDCGHPFLCSWLPGNLIYAAAAHDDVVVVDEGASTILQYWGPAEIKAQI